MNEYLRLLIFGDEEIRAESYSVLIAILFLILGIIISTYLTFRFRRDLQDLKEIKFVILPVYHITWLLLLRYIISLVDFIIWYVDDGETSLNGFYESILWLIIMIKLYTIISDQELIQISRIRIERYHLILLMLRILFILSTVIIFILNFIISNNLLETFSFVLLFIISYQIYNIMKIEMENAKSVINKIRLKFLIDFWKFFLIYFLATIIGYGLMGTLYPNGDIDGIYFTVVALFLNLTPIMIALSIYWSVFVPQRTRRKYGLSNPKAFL